MLVWFNARVKLCFERILFEDVWILDNITIGGTSLVKYTANFLNHFSLILGLDGMVLLAYFIAIPANEIGAPTMMMAK